MTIGLGSEGQSDIAAFGALDGPRRDFATSALPMR